MNQAASHLEIQRCPKALCKMKDFYRQKQSETRKLKKNIISGKVTFPWGRQGVPLRQISSLGLTRNSRLIGLKCYSWERLKLQLDSVLSLGGT